MTDLAATLATKIDTYQPTDATKELLQSTKIALLVGIAGAGKDTIKRELLARDGFRDIVSHTTRAPRSNDGIPEVDGVHYHFITYDQADEMLDAGAFIEAKFVHGTVYGTSAAALKAVHDSGAIALTDVDVQGVDEFKKVSPDVVAIFIIPPSYDIWRERLAKRYESNEAFAAEWQKRRTSALAELRHALEVPYYHFVINDELERVVTVADEIARRDDLFLRKDDEARLIARDLLAAIEADRSYK